MLAFKRAGVLFAALMVLSTVPGRLFPAAMAAEKTADTYVFPYIPCRLAYTMPCFYMSPLTIPLGPDGILDVSPDETKEPESPPEVRMDVAKLGAVSGSFDVGQAHTWFIRGGVPAGIGNGRRYEIYGRIDYRLTYQQGSPIVSLYTKAGKALLLRLDDHYTLEESQTNGAFDSFSVSLTPAGMAYVAANLERGDNTPEIHVCFQVAINENAAMGEGIANLAHLDYTNSVGVTYGTDSAAAKVYTGGIHIRKTDSSGTPLAGAAFQIARLATEAELASSPAEAVTLHIGVEERKVVFVSFYAEEDLGGGKVWEVTTKEDGMAVIYGLAYGEYYLIESKAPEGYNLQTQPVALIFNDVSHLTARDGGENEKGEIADNTITLVGTKFIIPETGGMGSTLFHVTGAAILGAACLLLLSNRNRRM